MRKKSVLPVTLSCLTNRSSVANALSSNRDRLGTSLKRKRFVEHNLLEVIAMFAKHLLPLTAATFALVLTSGAALATSQFEGTWKTQDSDGKPFQIVLAEEGKATGDRAGEALSGTWKTEGEAAVIDWGDGWTTKIVKQGSEFQKQGFHNEKPSGTADATKVQ